MLRKLKLLLAGQPLAARYNRCQDPVPGRGPAVEKHFFKAPLLSPHILHANSERYTLYFILYKFFTRFPRKTWMEGVRAAMKTRHLEADQWLNRKEWCLGSGRRLQLSQDRKDR
jgi:hypothetical protein